MIFLVIFLKALRKHAQNFGASIDFMNDVAEPIEKFW